SMPLRVSNLQLPVEQSEESLRDLLATALRVRATDISRWRILRKSLDARSRGDLRFVYSAIVEHPDDEQRVFEQLRDPRVELYSTPGCDEPESGDKPLGDRPVVVGSGPAGLLAAY